MIGGNENGHPGQGGRIPNDVVSWPDNSESNASLRDLQAFRLLIIFPFAPATARAVAGLCFGEAE